VTTRFTINLPAVAAICHGCERQVMVLAAYYPTTPADEIWCGGCRVSKSIVRAKALAAETKARKAAGGVVRGVRGGYKVDSVQVAGFWSPMGLLVTILAFLFLIGFATWLIH
jgi:hypothetical protein